MQAIVIRIIILCVRARFEVRGIDFRKRVARKNAEYNWLTRVIGADKPT